MNLPKELTAVTPLSKYLAMVVFIAMPFLGFFLGMRYQEMLNLTKRQEMEANLAIERAPTPTPIPIPTVNPQITANWKTYVYKNISFKYPNDWIVVFDSVVVGQTNGFSLHVQPEDSNRYQPDGLYISNWTSISGENDFKLSSNRKLVNTKNGDDYIQFEINETPIYARCSFYSEGDDTIEICNQILSTFRFLGEEQIYPKITKSTINPGWNIYQGVQHSQNDSILFSMEYPANWKRDRHVPNIFRPFGVDDLASVDLGGGGLGDDEFEEKRIFPAGEASYYWRTSSGRTWGKAHFLIKHFSFVFGMGYIPATKSAELESIFLKMLSTFRVINK